MYGVGFSKLKTRVYGSVALTSLTGVMMPLTLETPRYFERVSSLVYMYMSTKS